MVPGVGCPRVHLADVGMAGAVAAEVIVGVVERVAGVGDVSGRRDRAPCQRGAVRPPTDLHRGHAGGVSRAVAAQVRLLRDLVAVGVELRPVLQEAHPHHERAIRGDRMTVGDEEPLRGQRRDEGPARGRWKPLTRGWDRPSAKPNSSRCRPFSTAPGCSKGVPNPRATRCSGLDVPGEERPVPTPRLRTTWASFPTVHSVEGPRRSNGASSSSMRILLWERSARPVRNASWAWNTPSRSTSGASSRRPANVKPTFVDVAIAGSPGGSPRPRPS